MASKSSVLLQEMHLGPLPHAVIFSAPQKLISESEVIPEIFPFSEIDKFAQMFYDKPVFSRPPP
jgi:hypothetical protein